MEYTTGVTTDKILKYINYTLTNETDFGNEILDIMFSRNDVFEYKKIKNSTFNFKRYIHKNNNTDKLLHIFCNKIKLNFNDIMNIKSIDTISDIEFIVKLIKHYKNLDNEFLIDFSYKDTLIIVIIVEQLGLNLYKEYYKYYSKVGNSIQKLETIEETIRCIKKITYCYPYFNHNEYKKQIKTLLVILKCREIVSSLKVVIKRIIIPILYKTKNGKTKLPSYFYGNSDGIN